MDTGTEKNIPDWLNPDVLIVFIDELREAGYKIGIPQYIVAQDLILMLIAQGETLDSPEQLRNLLGPIFCSSPIEQEEFQQRFERWVKLFNKAHTLTKKVDIEAEALSAELETERALFYRMQSLKLLIPITIFISIILFTSHTNQKPDPKQIISSTPTFLPEIPPETLPTVPSKTPPTNAPFNWRIQLFLLIICVVIFLVWRLWWLWRANLFLQRHSTTQKPELQIISITGFEENLFPRLVLLKIARSLRHRIHVPSHEIDVNKTLDATLKQGGWLTPVYRNYQVIPEYLFFVNRTSYQDHQAKFIEEIIEGLKQEGVFITIYFFDDDPRICFADDNENHSFKLREIISKYSEHSLVMISDTENFFSSISGELEPWVNQLTSWKNRAFLTPTPVENWGYQELELAQEFIVLPATFKGLEVLSQKLRQGWATYFVGEEMQIPLPDSLRTRPYLWIERNPPPTEQINAMLESLEEYLGKYGFYWLSACAVFPKLHWNMTIYLGNVLKTESGAFLVEVCSLTDLVRLPWLRHGYMPNWLRVYLITKLTEEQQQIIRTALQNLLVTAIQGSASKFQLEIAEQHYSFLPKLANPILYLVSKKAAVDSPLRDYIFLGFMTGQSVLAMRISNGFSRSLQKQKRYSWWIKLLLLTLLGLSGAVGFIFWPILNPDPLRLENFSANKSQITEGDEVTLKWEIHNYQHLQKLVLTAKGSQPIQPITYDFSNGISETLGKGSANEIPPCQVQEKQKLICSNVKTGVKTKGNYTFELQSFYRNAVQIFFQNNQITSQTTQVEILPKPFKIVSFTVNGTEQPNVVLNEGTTVTLDWRVEGKNIQVKLLPYGNDIPPVGSIKLPVNLAFPPQIALQVNDISGKQQPQQKGFAITVIKKVEPK